MITHRKRLIGVALASIGLCTQALSAQQQTGTAAQTSGSVFRGVPKGEASVEPLGLSLADAVRRGLEQNLAVVIQQQQLHSTESIRLTALSKLLPHVSGDVRQTRQVFSTAAFGFNFPGFPSIIGPFGVFDARLNVSAPLFDPQAWAGKFAVDATVRAGQADLREIQETVVLAVGNLYLEAQTDAARVDSARAQLATAEALARLAEDQRAAGIIAGIDVLREQTQVQAAQARLITTQNAFEKRKLDLARAIGLPASQAFTLTDPIQFATAPPVTIDQVVTEAQSHREDVIAAQARVDAARGVKRAEQAGLLPSVTLNGDVGGIGSSASNVDRTYSVAAMVHVPIFEGGETRAKVLRADAELKEREATLADLTAGIRYEAQAALLDLSAADANVKVADTARSLANQQLTQAQDRFRAGVSSSLELVQAQEAVAAAAEQYTASVYAHTVAKALLARVMGQLQERFVSLVGGRQ